MIATLLLCLASLGDTAPGNQNTTPWSISTSKPGAATLHIEPNAPNDIRVDITIAEGIPESIQMSHGNILNNARSIHFRARSAFRRPLRLRSAHNGERSTIIADNLVLTREWNDFDLALPEHTSHAYQLIFDVGQSPGSIQITDLQFNDKNVSSKSTSPESSPSGQPGTFAQGRIPEVTSPASPHASTTENQPANRSEILPWVFVSGGATVRCQFLSTSPLKIVINSASDNGKVAFLRRSLLPSESSVEFRLNSTNECQIEFIVLQYHSESPTQIIHRTFNIPSNASTLFVHFGTHDNNLKRSMEIRIGKSGGNLQIDEVNLNETQRPGK